MLTTNNEPDVHEKIADNLEYCAEVIEQLEAGSMSLEVTVLCNALKGLVFATADLLAMSVATIQSTHNNTRAIHKLTKGQKL